MTMREITGRSGGTSEDVAQTIAKGISIPHPKARYTVTPSARVLITLRQSLPDNLWDRFLGGQFPHPR
jgi:mannitol/fructose-specific phosphotransferase system IIA component (Ntr-type)